MTRSDLLSLTPDALAALANRGLVKRAARALDAGDAPAIDEDADGTVHGVYADGVETALPAHADLQAASCSCGAPGVCRHRIGLVLAYQRQREESIADRSIADGSITDGSTADEPTADEAAFTPWSPGSVDDATLTELFGPAALAAARRTLAAGFPARLVRPTSEAPVARAELRFCTVRFLVPGEVGYAHTDAADAARGEMVVLAVWAFRAADQRGVDADDLRLDVGGRPPDAPAGGAETGLAPALAVVDSLLVDGVQHADSVLRDGLRRAAQDLERHSLRWPAAALAELREQLDAYQARSTQHAPERVAELLAEVHARHRAATHGAATHGAATHGAATHGAAAHRAATHHGANPPSGSPRSRVLGSDEPAETPLRRVHLTGLGCRISGTDTERTAEVFLAHPDSGTVLVLRRSWPARESPAGSMAGSTTGSTAVSDAAPLTGAQLATRRVSGVPLHTLAVAQLVSESASRSASRVVRLAASRVARTSVNPLEDGAWRRLPPTVTAPDLATLDQQLADLPPKLIRPRVEAELVRVIPVAEVLDLGYYPGDQRLDAVIADAEGTVATVSATYQQACPGALDALAAALSSESGTPRFVSGLVHRSGGQLTVRPIAVLTDQGPLLPDLAPGEGDADLSLAPEEPDPDPLQGALRHALTSCAEAAHHGLAHLTPSVRRRLGEAAAALSAVGLHTAAGLVTRLATASAGDDPDRLVTTWVDAQIRLTTTAELCAAPGAAP